jgi:hypothetical protein
MAAGVVLIDEVFGREALVRHLGRLAVTAMDPKADMVAEVLAMRLKDSSAQRRDPSRGDWTGC